jgi:predicted phosphodiesterase
MKLGVIADVHGNDVALRAVLDDAAGYHVDRWWVLGDLVLFGPRPAEALDRLRGLPGVSMLRGNTDRYVLTGEQPAPHATAADAVGRIDLVERYVVIRTPPSSRPSSPANATSSGSVRTPGCPSCA